MEAPDEDTQLAQDYQIAKEKQTVLIGDVRRRKKVVLVITRFFVLIGNKLLILWYH